MCRGNTANLFIIETSSFSSPASSQLPSAHEVPPLADLEDPLSSSPLASFRFQLSATINVALSMSADSADVGGCWSALASAVGSIRGLAAAVVFFC